MPDRALTPSAPALRLWDLSPPVSPASPVFPGDTAYAQQWVATLDERCPVNVSAVTLSPHVGAHADAPLHYAAHAAAVGTLDLLPYLGPCRVIHALDARPLVRLADLAHALPPPLGRGPAGAMPVRLLVRCYAQMPQAAFDEALPALDPPLLEALADHGLRLIGTDSASIDPAESKALPSHQVLARRDLRVLENLCLDAVPEGDYELIALPLRWTQADASPVRAVLRELPR